MDLLAPNQSVWLFVAQATNKAVIVAPALNCLFLMRVRKGAALAHKLHEQGRTPLAAARRRFGVSYSLSQLAALQVAALLKGTLQEGAEACRT
jgi:hypothetical protein